MELSTVQQCVQIVARYDDRLEPLRELRPIVSIQPSVMGGAWMGLECNGEFGTYMHIGQRHMDLIDMKMIRRDRAFVFRRLETLIRLLALRLCRQMEAM